MPVKRSVCLYYVKYRVNGNTQYFSKYTSTHKAYIQISEQLNLTYKINTLLLIYILY